MFLDDQESNPFESSSPHPLKLAAANSTIVRVIRLRALVESSDVVVSGVVTSVKLKQPLCSLRFPLWNRSQLWKVEPNSLDITAKASIYT